MSNPFITELVQRIDGRFAQDTDTMSLGDWICANTMLRGRNFNFDRYPFQKAIADELHPNMDVIKPSQVGLALALDTPVPTPTGWTTMGALQAGDMVYDEQGQPTRVEYVSPIYSERDCYDVQFDTGEVITADGQHRWYVECAKAFNAEGLYPHSGRIPLTSDYTRNGVITTKLLSEIGFTHDRNLFAIPTTKPLQTPVNPLPLDPYFLGLWLGDGSSHSATLTSTPLDYEFYAAELQALGFKVSPQTGTGFSVDLPNGVRRHRLHDYDSATAKLYGVLKHLDVINNKHVPQAYLRAAPADRLSLLQGLLDTDGSITNGRISFHNCNRLLIEAFEELAASLGFKTRTRWRSPQDPCTMKSGHIIVSKQAIAEVTFVAYSDQVLFRLPRKQSKVKALSAGRPSESFRRRVVSVTPVATTPVRCISVASESHLFLAGRGMIPTHNTEVQIRKALGFLARHRGTSLIFTLPTDDMYERVATTRILPLVKQEKVFNLETANGEKPVRSRGIIQIGTSFLYVTGAKEGDATSIPADVVFNDELDLSDQKMMALFGSRMQNSDWKISQRFSTPTFASFGIDAGFQASDQRVYMVQCDACNHWQEPTFTEDSIELPGLALDKPLIEIDNALIDTGTIRLDDAYVCCEKCRAPLDLGRTDNREWVAKYTSRTNHRGYRVSPFSTDRLSVNYIVTEMMKYQRKDYMRGWYNTVLGMPFTSGSARLSDAQIAQCFTAMSRTPEVDATAPTWIGIDMGQVCHIKVGQGTSKENQHIIMFKAVPVEQLFEEVQEILDTYNVIGGAVDRHPYTPTADALHLMSQGRIIPVEYRGLKELNLVGETPEKPNHAQANRTALIDAAAKAVRMGRVRFSGYGQQKSIITEHLKDMVRDENPEKPATWVKLTGNDHYFHALGFLLFAIDLQEAVHFNGEQRSTVAVVPVSVSADRSSLFNIRRP